LNILTKVFIIMTLVFSLTLAVFVALLLNQQTKYLTAYQTEQVQRLAAQAYLTKIMGQRDNLRVAVENSRNDKLASDAGFQQTIRNLQTQIAGQQREIAAKAAELTNAQAGVTALTTSNQTMTDTVGKLNGELEALRQQVPVLTQQAAELSRLNNEYKTGLEAAQNAIRRLQEELAEAQKSPASAAATAITGK